MPKIFRAADIPPEETEARRDYFDRHTPHVICETSVPRGAGLRVKVRLGERYSHPDEPDHHIRFVQLWDLETFLAEVQFAPGAQGGMPGQVEVDFYLRPHRTLRLKALAACTKHGLWESRETVVRVTD